MDTIYWQEKKNTPRTKNAGIMDERQILTRLKSYAHGILSQHKGEKDVEQAWEYALRLFDHELKKLDNDLFHLY